MAFFLAFTICDFFQINCQIQISENNKSCCSKNNNIIDIKQEEEQKEVAIKTNISEEQSSKMKTN